MGLLRIFLPVVFCTASIAAPVLEFQPRPAAPDWLAIAPADRARDAVLAACGAGAAGSRIAPPPDCWFTVSEAGVLRGLILRRGGPFNPAPPPSPHPRLLGVPEPLAFAMLGCGAVALGFVRRGRAPAMRR